MDDGFEYAVTDFGLGMIQVRPVDDLKYLSPQVFWVKFRIVNKAEHLIQNPKYFVSRVVDNWGNTYSLRDLATTSISGNLIGGSPPIPVTERRDSYKPGDVSWGLKIVPAGEFVDGITEFRMYFANPSFGRESYFKIAKPILRNRDLLREQTDPRPSELKITLVTETLIPTQAPAGKRKQ